MMLVSTAIGDNIVYYCIYIVCRFKGSLVKFRLILIGDAEIPTISFLSGVMSCGVTSSSLRIRMIITTLVIVIVLGVKGLKIQFSL